MRSGTTIIVLRSIIAGLLAALAVAALLDGRVVIGVLLGALAVTNVTLTVTVHRRRRELQARFPGLAARRGRGDGPGAGWPRAA